jgi:hypothetical protein
MSMTSARQFYNGFLTFYLLVSPENPTRQNEELGFIIHLVIIIIIIATFVMIEIIIIVLVIVVNIYFYFQNGHSTI